MSNPNRVMANSYRAQSSDYWCFPTRTAAARFASFVEEAGFKVRESKFRVGPRPTRDNPQRYSYRVSVYWTEGNGPDRAAFNAAAYR